MGDLGHTAVPFTASLAAVGVDVGRRRSPSDGADSTEQIIGRASIRYALTDYLLKYDGHIGYAVAPEHRRRGYATEILRQSLALLAARGIDRALVTCDDDNVGSYRTIEACGGVLENTIDGPDGVLKRRYRIDLSA